jgi:hypothetical protein
MFRRAALHILSTSTRMNMLRCKVVGVGKKAVWHAAEVNDDLSEAPKDAKFGNCTPDWFPSTSAVQLHVSATIAEIHRP